MFLSMPTENDPDDADKAGETRLKALWETL